MTARKLGEWPDRSEPWLAARRGRIGGSDIGTVLGWNRFQTRNQLIAEKLGQAEPKQTTAAMKRGIYCEPAIAAWLAAKEGITYDPAMRGTWVDVDRDWAMYNPDGVTTDGRLVEFKTASVRDTDHGWGRAGSDSVPLAYAAQCVWGMGILGLSECLLAVLSGQPRFEFARYRITFDAELFAYLTEQAERFLAELHDLQTRTAA